MPNWCQNELIIETLDQDEFKRFTDQLQHLDFYQEVPDLSFDRIRPLPDAEKENWYDWQVENWGTKWDVHPDHFKYGSEGYLYYSFETAWAPPDKIIDYIARKYTNLNINLKYYEPSMSFAGEIDYQGGEQTFQNEYAYGHETDEYLDFVEHNFDDYIREMYEEEE